MREKYPYVEDVGLVISLIDGLVGVTSHTTPLPTGEGLGEGPLSCGLKTCAKRLSELCALCERKTFPACCLCVIS